MQNSLDESPQAYFKQYSCYNFSLFGCTPIVDLQYRLQFQIPSTQAIHLLPAVLVDNIDIQKRMYLLQWARKESTDVLHIRELHSQNWIMVEFNYLPEHIIISGAHLFVIAGSELFIVSLSLNKKQKKKQKLPNDRIIAVNASIATHNDSPDHSSILIIFFSSKKGYYKCEYSTQPSTKQTSSLSLTSIIGGLLNKETMFVHFQVLIPNVLALVFTSDNQCCLYNMTKMKAETQTTHQLQHAKLQANEIPVIRWRIHDKLQNCSQTLMVLIGVGASIQIIFLNINFTIKQELRSYFQNASLTNIIGGDIIDWNSLSILPYVTLSIEGNILIDMVISKTGVVYYSKDQINSPIGYAKYIDLTNLFSQITILNQQAIVWKKYYQDRKYSPYAKSDTLFQPNRYPSQLLLNIPVSKNDNRGMQILNLWRNQYTFKAVIDYKEDILIVRKGSISIFRNINELMYELQQFSQSKLLQLQSMNGFGPNQINELDQLFEKQNDQFEEPLFRGLADQVIVQERKYYTIDFEEQDSNSKLLQNQANQTFEEIRQIINNKHQAVYSNMKITPFKYNLTCNLVKDKLNYYTLILSHKLFKIQSSNHIQRERCKTYEMQLAILRTVTYYKQLSERSSSYFFNYNSQLLDMFIQSNSNKLSQDIDTSVSIILQLLFKDLLPTVLTNYKDSALCVQINFENKIKNNAFIQFVVQQLTGELKKCRESRGKEPSNHIVWKLRMELSKIIKIGLLGNNSIYFSQLWKNQSIFKALLLSNQPEFIDKCFCQYFLLKNQKIKQSIQTAYFSLKQFMPVSQMQQIQKFILFNRHYTKIPFDSFYMHNENPKTFGDEQHYQSLQCIFSQLLLAQKNNFKVDNQAQIRYKFECLLTQLKMQDYKELKGCIESTRLTSSDEYLCFYQLLLINFIKLFNKTTSQNLPPLIAHDEQNKYWINRRWMLLFFGKIKQYFQQYKHHYFEVYGTSIVDSFQEQFNQEQELMNSLLDSVPTLLSDPHGFVCSHLSLTLIEAALRDPQLDNDTAYTDTSNGYQFQSSFSNKNDLINFFLNIIAHFKQDEQPIYWQQVFKYGKSQVKHFIALTQQSRQDEYYRLKSYIAKTGKKYQFSSLL